MSGFMDKIIERVRRETTEKVRRETTERVRRETTEKVRRKTALENALKMIKKGKLTLEEIAEYAGLSLTEVKELAAKNPV